MKVVAELQIEKIDLEPADKQKLLDLLKTHIRAFAVSDTDMGCSNTVLHRINTGSHSPVKQRARREPVKYRDKIKAEVERLLSSDIVRPSMSPWASVIMVVQVLEQDSAVL